MKKMMSFILALILIVCAAGCGNDSNYSALIGMIEAGDVEGIKKELSVLVPEFGAEMEESAAQLESYKARLDELERALDDSGEGEEVSDAADGIVRLAAETLNGFMAEKGNDMAAQFEHETASEAREATVVHAMEYRLGNCDGKGSRAHCLLIYVSGDFAVTDGFNDNLQLLLDMDTQTLYDSSDIDWGLIEACGGMPGNMEEFFTVALNSYHSYVAYGADILMADMEICEELSEEQIEAVNAALK